MTSKIFKWKCPECNKEITSLYEKQFEQNKEEHKKTHKKTKIKEGKKE